MTAYFKPPKTGIDESDTPECENLISQDILPNLREQCMLECSTFVPGEEVALIDRFLGAEIAALFHDQAAH